MDVSEGPNVDVVYDPDSWPFGNDINRLFDVIISSSCFEHDDFFWSTFVNMVSSLKPNGIMFINVPSSGGVHRYPIDSWRLYADSAYSLARWAAKNGEDICVLHSSSMPFNTSNPHLHSSDTSMIFWKPTDGITYKDCHPKSKNDCAHADDFQCVKSNPTEEINLEIIALRRFHQLKMEFLFFANQMIDRFNDYMILVKHHSLTIPNNIERDLLSIYENRDERQQSYSHLHPHLLDA
eukprot:CAMPEP_0170129144 /NCGR_PEP_ID=MMETSP0020_2-20130122/21659_1 /TAXON_ID=98059 /ORGANISM="Dinobryon sp., Strain UTEXLB2267" /LENGTH=236 /DNA_ID=CAMNT_0010363335 /DNA_START=226 /DNA_END=936 /DNA_ORIENTATION=-